MPYNYEKSDIQLKHKNTNGAEKNICLYVSKVSQRAPSTIYIENINTFKLFFQKPNYEMLCKNIGLQIS